MATLALPLAMRARRLCQVSLVACAAAQSTTAHAHRMVVTAAGKPVFDWQFSLWVTALLTVSIGLYAIGFARVYGRSCAGRGDRRWQATAFVLGWATLTLALVSPLGALSDALFSAHMVEHEAMMLICAPLLVLGRPLGIMLWAFPHRLRLVIGRAVRAPAMAVSWRRLTSPLCAWALHAAALWAWHVPTLFEAAVAHPAIHAMQHASFLITALLLWRGIVGEGATRRGSGHAMLSLFTTMVHTGALGALIALAPGIWYPSYVEPTSLLGIDPLRDQQLGGLIMWVPGAIAYLVGALAVASRWLIQGPRKTASNDWPALGMQQRFTSGKPIK